jgi:hypothetical protein
MEQSPATQLPEIERLRGLLNLMFSVLGISFREAEKKLGLGFGHFSKAFQGSRDFRLEHIYEFCDVSGLHPAEFFHRAYASLPEERSEASRKLAWASGLLGGSTGGDPTALEESPFLTLRVTRSRFQGLGEEVRKALLELIEQEGGVTPDSSQAG